MTGFELLIVAVAFDSLNRPAEGYRDQKARKADEAAVKAKQKSDDELRRAAAAHERWSTPKPQQPAPTPVEWSAFIAPAVISIAILALPFISRLF